MCTGWNMDFDLPDLEESKDDSELTSITASLPTSVTSSTVTIHSQSSTAPVRPTTVSRANKVC